MKNNILKISLTAAAATLLAAGGCSGANASPGTVTATPTPYGAQGGAELATPSATATVTPTPFVSETLGRYEAEDARLNGKVKVVTVKGSRQISGEAYVKGFEDEGDSCTFTINVPSDGFYNLIFKQQGIPSTAIRLLSEHIPDLSTLGLPPAVMV